MCRYFRANCTTIAVSGRGLIHNSGCHADLLMPQLYTRTFATGAREPWDFSASTRPDAVIVYLGTNDYSCNQTTDARFTAAYVEFVQNVTRAYAGAAGPAGRTHFFCALGPMSPTRPRNATLAAVRQLVAAGVSASLLDMTNGTVALDGCGASLRSRRDAGRAWRYGVHVLQTGRRPRGFSPVQPRPTRRTLVIPRPRAPAAGGHPGPIGHWELALQAAPQIKSAMGW